MSDWFDDIDDQVVGETKETKAKPVDRDFARYSKDIARAIAQGVSFGSADEIEAFVDMLRTDVPYDQAVKKIRAEIEAFRRDEPFIAYPAEILGSVPTGIGAGAGLAKMGVQSLAKQAGIEGAVYGAMAGEDTVSDRVKGAIGGGLIGAGVTKALPAMSTQAKKLRDIGLPMTIGQMIGGRAKTLEEAAEAVPFVGGTVRKGRSKAIEGFNEATYNKILAPIGGKLPKGVVGREAYNEAQKQIQNEYNAIMPNLIIPADANIQGRINSIIQSAAEEFGDSKQGKSNFEVFKKKVEQVLLARIDKDGSISGSQLRQAMTELKNQSYKFSNDPDAFKQTISSEFSNVADMMSNALIDANPQYAQRLKNVNEAFSMLIPAERASVSLGAKGGKFTPAQLLSGIKFNDPSLRKKDFARGTARLQDFAETADEVIGSELGKSPTFEKTLAMSLLTGTGYGLGGSTGGAIGIGAPIAANVIASPLYSKLGRDAAEVFLGDVMPTAKVGIGRSVAPTAGGLLGEDVVSVPANLLGVGQAQAAPSRYTYEQRVDRMGNPYTIAFDEMTGTATRID